MVIARVFCVAAAILTFYPVTYAADDADAIIGQWLTEKGEARFEIFKSGGKYHGKIVWLKEPTYPPGDKEAGKPVRDRSNPDESKRNRPIIGLQILNGFTFAGNNLWSTGTIYNSDDGKTYKAQLKLKSQDKLHVRGYIGIPLLGGTTVWTRYKEPPATQQPPKR